ncbi:MAG: hypothetical protein F6K24_29005, partial [Okeania sp. SIO2D1]|nr:hypothetical protein [Okeania sp. SIO2D1]
MMEQKKWEVAKEKFEEVLNLDPDNKLAQDKLREILREIEKIKLIKMKRNYFTLGILTGVLGVLPLIGIEIWEGLQHRGNQLIRERFSSGDKILFANANKENYNDEFSRCNQEFQNQNYDAATDCFQELVKDNRNEPEPLIYYNNSLARQHNNSIKIAVAVPADRNPKRSKSMLRGVAPAQNEYNKKQKNSPSQNRLLEIVIANDSNNDKISPKLAKEI